MKPKPPYQFTINTITPTVTGGHNSMSLNIKQHRKAILVSIYEVNVFKMMYTTM